MSTINYSGFWTGTFEGTNYGGMTLDIKQSDGILVGIAKFSEQSLGQYEYSVPGVAADPLALQLNPSRTYGPVDLGAVSIVCSFDQN
jgi:hypothetical protein